MMDKLESNSPLALSTHKHVYKRVNNKLKVTNLSIYQKTSNYHYYA